ncbi:MAG: hypothetical protein LBT91_02900 [Bifidobacteriaceae bacterium]|jgi:hypothetical protein|nr:hypothetical protein [Bifidobacteriaceae bacterium]
MASFNYGELIKFKKVAIFVLFFIATITSFLSGFLTNNLYISYNFEKRVFALTPMDILPISLGGLGNSQGIAPLADKLENARAIDNISFNGTENINISEAIMNDEFMSNSDSTGSYTRNYVKFSNGLIIQWGVLNTTCGPCTPGADYKIPFTNAQYGLTVSRRIDSGQNIVDYNNTDQGSKLCNWMNNMCYDGKLTSGFRIDPNYGLPNKFRGHDWMAIGI